MNVAKNDLFALERAYALLCDMVENGSADLTFSEQCQLDFGCIKETLGEPKRLKDGEPSE
jgi:hypothetical protein